MLRCNLPEFIELPNGAVLYPVIGGHLKQKPFIAREVQECLAIGDRIKTIVAEAKRQGLKYRRVEVLSRNLRGKLDLHRQLYRPSKWVFVEVKATEKGDLK